MPMPAPRVGRYSHLPGAPVRVTSVLSAVFPKPGLQRWLLVEAIKAARDNPHLNPDQVLNLRDKDTEARDRGSRVHKAIEHTLAGDPDKIPHLYETDNAMYCVWREWWDKMGKVFEVLGTELVVAGHGYAGTLDLLGYDPDFDSRFIGDWKTASRLPDEPYEDHAVQLAAYASANLVTTGLYEGPMPAIDHGRVVYISTEGVREFAITGEDWAMAKERWRATWRLFTTLWPQFEPELGVGMW
jgi:hypothetical protein